MQNHDLGLNPDQILVIQTPRRGGNLGSSVKTFRQAIATLTQVKNTTVSSVVPGEENTWVGGGLRLTTQDETQEKQCYAVRVSEDFLETYEIGLIAGRGFSRDFATESESVLLNEQAVALLGIANPEDAIGKRIFHSWSDSASVKIVGVIQNYHQQSLKESLNPTIFTFGEVANYISVKLQTSEVGETIKNIQDEWVTVFPGEPFDAFFLDQSFERQYREDEHFSKVFTLFSALSILVACLGLFGLASFTAQQKTREIGIRKVLGAGISNIFLMFSRSYVGLIGLATALAAPLTYFLMNRWLQNYAFRIAIDWLVFLRAGAFGLAIALLTISHHAIRAALANPVESLRDE